LKEKIRRKIKCPETLWLIDMILDHSNEQERRTYFPGDDLLTPSERRHGLPIGNLTSQLWANVYLSPLDHLMAERFGGRRYVRSWDDFALFSDDPAELRAARSLMARELEKDRLRLHPVKTQIFETRQGPISLVSRLAGSDTGPARESQTRAQTLAPDARDYGDGFDGN